MFHTRIRGRHGFPSLDELRAIHPDRRIELKMNGDLRGLWDGRRLQQLLGNLVMNAIKYGSRDAPVRVAVNRRSRSHTFNDSSLQ
jgi:signal transduction histidine kinase